PNQTAAGGAVLAARELITPKIPGNAAQLAQTIECLYAQHARFMKLEPARWLELLDRFATAQLVPEPDHLDVKLHQHLDAQWVVVDCLGVPLLSPLRDLLPATLLQWQLCSLGFALAPQRTSTETFYLMLIEQEFKKSFEKVNAVDH